MFTAEGLEPFTRYRICLAASNQYTQVDEGVSLEVRVDFKTTEGSKCVVCVCVNTLHVSQIHRISKLYCPFINLIHFD